MAVSTRQQRCPEPKSELVKKTAASILISGPFFVAGGYGITESDLPGWATGVFLLVGLFLAGVALISVGRVFPPLALFEGEQLMVSRHPTMKPAFARMFLSIPFFAGAWWLFEFTLMPYVYPFAVFVVAMYILFKGAMRYLRNLHITYTVTDSRVVQQYRFLWLNTKEIPTNSIISISEARNLFVIITGRGSVIVSSSVGERQTVRIEDISDPGPVTVSIRKFFD